MDPFIISNVVDCKITEWENCSQNGLNFYYLKNSTKKYTDNELTCNKIVIGKNNHIFESQ